MNNVLSGKTRTNDETRNETLLHLNCPYLQSGSKGSRKFQNMKKPRKIWRLIHPWLKYFKYNEIPWDLIPVGSHGDKN